MKANYKLNSWRKKWWEIYWTMINKSFYSPSMARSFANDEMRRRYVNYMLRSGMIDRSRNYFKNPIKASNKKVRKWRHY